ncbi:E3 ubiquitin-protein ligase synoviolin-like [Ostrea edulis]|uniref:E3 ubiquitin-protein ligase synoviolin-like n=1 Tax=Ostrea edulis TaxID=37623 RepID=UPI0020965A35|nr:E3 ubiquitin-protein ligase synoviolin-like [Ostrea edulis]
MKTLLVTGLSFVLSGAVIGNAYYQKKQFYPSVVYITKSNPSMAMLYIQAFVFIILMGKVMRKVFFGSLRPAEVEHLIERSWYAVTETCLAFTVFRDDFSPKFVALFTLLLFLKCFHWLAEDRIDYMERSPVISVLFHIRALTLLALLGVLDLYFINHAYYSTLTKGASVQLVFGFEYAILMTIIAMTFMKYILHSIDLQNENPWDNKAVYLLYTEVVLGAVKVVLYMAFMVIMIKVHTFPLFAIRPMYLSMRGFKKALHDVIMSRRAIRNMNTHYPDATEEELQVDDVCIICRETMVTAAKKLPCNHIFHTSCLRSWFQRQQTCPTCRRDVLRTTPITPQATPPPQPAQPQPPQNMFGGLAGMPGVPPQMWPQPPVPPQQPNPAQMGNNTPVSQTTTSTGNVSSTFTPPSVSTSTTAATGLPAGMGSLPTGVPPMMPMFPLMMPFGMPRPPANLSELSAEDLRRIEGQERENVEARIQWLRDIQALMDGAMVMISQYNTVAAQLSTPVINTNNSPTNTSQEAKPKTESTEAKAEIKTEPSESDLNYDGLEGATGYTPPKEEEIPQWEDPSKEEHEDEMHEVRRRRLQKFAQEQNQTSDSTS